MDANRLCKPLEPSRAIFSRYRSSGSLEHLNSAISHAERTLRQTPPRHGRQALRQSLLCYYLGCRMYHSGVNPFDLQYAVMLAGQVQGTLAFAEHATVNETQESTFEFTNIMRLLGLFGGTNQKSAGGGKGRPPPSHSPAILCQNLVKDPTSMFAKRSDIGSVEELEAACFNVELAVLGSSPGHPERHMMFATWAFLSVQIYLRTDDIQRLETAIDKQREAVSSAPVSLKAGFLSDLASSVSLRYEKLSDKRDLAEAVLIARKAVSSLPSLETSVAHVVCNGLIALLKDQYELSGSLGLLDEGIETAHRVVAAEAPGAVIDPVVGANFCATVGCMLLERHGHNGEIRDLSEAIEYTEKALRLGGENHPTRMSMLSNLSNMHHERFSVLRNSYDLHRAGTLCAEALTITPEHDPSLRRMMANHALHLASVHDRYDEPEVLDEAISVARRALEISSRKGDVVSELHLLDCLSHLLGERYDCTGEFKDAEEAVHHAWRVVNKTPQEHSTVGRRYNTLSKALFRLFERTGESRLLQEGIEICQTAVSLTSSSSLNRAPLLINLGVYFQLRYEARREKETQALHRVEEGKPLTSFLLARAMNGLSWGTPTITGCEDDFHASIRAYREASQSQAAHIVLRVAAARHAAGFLASRKRWREGLKFFENAVEMMTLIGRSPVWRQDQNHELSQLSGLGPVAASVALEAGESVCHAVKLLETGRGVFIGLTIDHRREVPELRSEKSLFASFKKLRNELDSISGIVPTLVNVSSAEHGQVIKRRTRLLHDLDNVRSKIQQLPGYQDFSLPLTPSALQALAQEGPLIIINSTKHRNDAIIITLAGIENLRLPLLAYGDARERMKEMQAKLTDPEASLRTYAQRNKRMAEILWWLWEAVVGPVLSHLQPFFQHQRLSRLPHLWWIGTGPLSQAPFHAAGDHSLGSRNNTFSHAISSYIPTLRALAYAREAKPLFDRSTGPSENSRTNSPAQLLIASMPTTPGSPDLPGVAKEVAAIQKIANSVQRGVQTTVHVHPTRATILASLASPDILHFACHGISDNLDPVCSGLLLRHAEDEKRVDVLAAHEISALNMKRDSSAGSAQIAYLSACSTAAGGPLMLADESCSISSGFQLAGFSHVLGTLWPSNDGVCTLVAEEFYRSLLYGSQGAVGHLAVSEAFHAAVGKARDLNRRLPLAWAGFIHTGA